MKSLRMLVLRIGRWYEFFFIFYTDKQSNNVGKDKVLNCLRTILYIMGAGDEAN